MEDGGSRSGISGEKDRIDKLFELGLLLVTVLAASELGYAAVRFATELGNVNFIFRALTIPIVILILVWIINELVPSPSSKVPLTRFLREFCWGLLGNLFVLEILMFVALSFTVDPLPLSLWVNAGTFTALFITLPAIWQYREIEHIDSEKRLRYRLVGALVEYLPIYGIAYILLVIVANASSVATTP